MAIRRRDGPLAGQPLDAVAAAARPARLALQVAQRNADRSLVRCQQRRRDDVVIDREQHADALGRREREIKPRDCRPLAHPAQHRPVPRVQTAHQREKLRPPDLASRRQSERANASAAPLAGGLTAAGEVVLDAGRHLRVVVLQTSAARPQLPDRQHGRRNRQRKGRKPHSAAETPRNPRKYRQSETPY
jgi:hypothetical protein